LIERSTLCVSWQFQLPVYSKYTQNTATLVDSYYFSASTIAR
jgi:hypothetical protein